MTKYDLRAPRQSLLVFCLSSNYQYHVMNINYSGIYGTVKRKNSTKCNNLKLMGLLDAISAKMTS